MDGKKSKRIEVFINCPFDSGYQASFRALVFAVTDCECVARCALEADDSGEVRVQKILRIIGECQLGIHDISCTDLDPENHLPRFNMPLELGFFLGAKKFGNKAQQGKSCLILDSERFRFQKFISDIAGQDIKAHGNDPDKIIIAVRNWLGTNLKGSGSILSSGKVLVEKYHRFTEMLPSMCADARLIESELTYTDYIWLVHQWLANEK